MIKAIISDLSRVLLFPVDEKYNGKLNALHKKLLQSGDYDFWKYFKINEELLEFYQKISLKIDFYMFTSGTIQEYPPLKEKLDPIFKTVFSATRLGVKKDDPEAYRKLADIIQVEVNEILVVDDDQKIIECIKKTGMITFQYENNEDLIRYIEKELNPAFTLS